jgi:hypothetical protein
MARTDVMEVISAFTSAPVCKVETEQGPAHKALYFCPCSCFDEAPDRPISLQCSMPSCFDRRRISFHRIPLANFVVLYCLASVPKIGLYGFAGWLPRSIRRAVKALPRGTLKAAAAACFASSVR